MKRLKFDENKKTEEKRLKFNKDEFNCLPFEIISFFCQKLNYKDLSNFSKTSKRNKNVAELILFNRYKKISSHLFLFSFLNEYELKKDDCYEICYELRNHPDINMKTVHEEEKTKLMVFHKKKINPLFPFDFHKLKYRKETKFLHYVPKLDNLKYVQFNSYTNLSFIFNTTRDWRFLDNVSEFMSKHPNVKTLSLVDIREESWTFPINWKLNKLYFHYSEISYNKKLLQHLKDQNTFNILKIKNKKFEDVKFLNKLKCEIQIVHDLYLHGEKNILEEINKIENLTSIKFLYQYPKYIWRLSNFSEVTDFFTFNNWSNLKKLYISSLEIETLYDLLKNKTYLRILKCEKVILNNKILDRTILENLCKNRTEKITLFLEELYIINMKNNLELKSDKLNIEFLINSDISRKIYNCEMCWMVRKGLEVPTNKDYYYDYE